MLSGYLMTARQLKDLDEQHRANGEPGSWGDFDITRDPRPWVFRGEKEALEALVRLPADSSDLRRKDLGEQIKVGSSAAFKIWRLSRVLRTTCGILGAAVLVWLGWFLRANWSSSVCLARSQLPLRDWLLLVY